MGYGMKYLTLGLKNKNKCWIISKKSNEVVKSYREWNEVVKSCMKKLHEKVARKSCMKKLHEKSMKSCTKKFQEKLHEILHEAKWSYMKKCISYKVLWKKKFCKEKSFVKRKKGWKEKKSFWKQIKNKIIFGKDLTLDTCGSVKCCSRLGGEVVLGGCCSLTTR